MKVIAINGSPRVKGNTSILLNYTLKEIEAENIDTEIINLSNKSILSCTACKGCAKSRDSKCILKDDFNEIMSKLISADGILIGSPVYFADVTGKVKSLLERIGYVARMNNGLLKRKVGAAVLAVRRGGALPAIDSINHTFLILDMIIPGSTYWNFGVGEAIGDVENDKEGFETIKNLGKNFAWLLHKISN